MFDTPPEAELEHLEHFQVIDVHARTHDTSIKTKCSKCSITHHKAGLLGLLLAEHEAFEERAAIMEFDGGVSRAEAEVFAHALTVLAFGPRETPATPITTPRHPASEQDDRVRCIDCQHYEPHAFRCLNRRQALLQSDVVGPALAALRQRCHGYAPAWPAP